MARRQDDETWRELWQGIRELSDYFESRIVFIGGIAVYLHVKAGESAFVEFSHDGDFYISLADFAALRDIEEVTKNLRLKKCQISKHGVEFDVYVERQSALRVPYEDVERASVVIDGVRVASLEHMLLLKLDAHRDRRTSQKGQKDERDIIRLVSLFSPRGPRPSLLKPFLTEEMVDMLAEIERSPQFFVLCQRNAQQASRLRTAFKSTVADIGKVLPPSAGRRK